MNDSHLPMLLRHQAGAASVTRDEAERLLEALAQQNREDALWRLLTA